MVPTLRHFVQVVLHDSYGVIDVGLRGRELVVVGGPSVGRDVWIVGLVGHD